MNGETPYRLVLLMIAIVQNGFAFAYLRKADPVSTIFQRRAEGPVLTILISFCFALYCVAGATYLVEPVWMDWSAIALPTWLRWLGMVPLLISSCMIIWGARHIGKNYTLSISTRRNHQLVTSGPYRWVRHPLYTGFLIGTVGVSMFIANWFIALSGGATWTLLAVRTNMEEENLKVKFGPDYETYRQQVGMFLPRLRRISRPENSDGRGVPGGPER